MGAYLGRHLAKISHQAIAATGAHSARQGPQQSKGGHLGRSKEAPDHACRGGHAADQVQVGFPDVRPLGWGQDSQTRLKLT